MSQTLGNSAVNVKEVVLCSSRKSIYRLTEIPRGRGGFESTFLLKESIMLGWNFWKGGSKLKNLS